MVLGKFNYLILLLIFVFYGCNNYRTYKLTSLSNVKSVHKDKLSIHYYKGEKILKHYIYEIPQSVCLTLQNDSIIPYVEQVYRLTQKKEFHRYANDKKVIQENDSIIQYEFKYPNTIHGRDLYVYNLKECKIEYISIYSGKF